MQQNEVRVYILLLHIMYLYICIPGSIDPYIPKHQESHPSDSAKSRSAARSVVLACRGPPVGEYGA